MELYVSGARPSALPYHRGTQPDSPHHWWQTPYGRWRLEVEREAMRRFPGFNLGCDPGGVQHWVGWLQSGLEDGDRYLLQVMYPRTFPDEAPMVAIHDPSLPEGTPHVLARNRPCLFLPSDGPRHGYDPARTTAATLVAWTALWIHAFETWRATDRWPGRAA
jgi:hypothetical protein